MTADNPGRADHAWKLVLLLEKETDKKTGEMGFASEMAHAS